MVIVRSTLVILALASLPIYGVMLLNAAAGDWLRKRKLRTAQR
ncbi:hypothetical protein [Bradyrhizobium sp. 930_D9_N1_4]